MYMYFRLDDTEFGLAAVLAKCGYFGHTRVPIDVMAAFFAAIQ